MMEARKIVMLGDNGNKEARLMELGEVEANNIVMMWMHCPAVLHVPLTCCTPLAPGTQEGSGKSCSRLSSTNILPTEWA